MPRQATGSVIERAGKRGVTLALRYRVDGQRRFETLPAGTTRQEAERVLGDRLAAARLGLLTPDVVSEPAAADGAEQTLHVFASRWVADREPELKARSIEAIRWALTCHLLGPLGSYRLDELTPQLVDRYRSAKVREREFQARLIEAWKLADPKARGRRPSPGLSNRSVNATLAVLGQVWDAAFEYGLVTGQNPARGRRRRLKQDPPRTRFLEPDQVAVLFDHAGGHRTLLATLYLAGLRVSELCALRWEQVDLGRGRLEVIDSKTSAGRRIVPLTPVLREALTEHRAGSSGEGFVFPSGAGTMRDRHNVRHRVVEPSVRRANEALVAAGEAPMPRVTPHDLRRTAISLWLASGVPVPDVMAWAGHARPDVTLTIYARILRHGVDRGSQIDALLTRPMGTNRELVPNDVSRVESAVGGVSA
jgi:integrase